jgi:hypothetical protein
VAWSPGSGPIRAARDAQPGRRVLCRAVIGVQGGSRSKRQGWTRPAGRAGAPLADVTAVRGTPCAFAPGVAGHTAPLPQAGRGEPRCRRGTFTCATFACATSPGARASMRRDEQDFGCLAGRSVRGRRDVREVHRPGAAGCGPGSGRGQDAPPRPHRHRAHPARPDPRGRGRRRQGPGVAGDQPGGGPPARRGDHRPGPAGSLGAHPVHSARYEGPGAVAAGGAAAGPRLHRHRAHPARPDPRGRGRRRPGARQAGR